MTQLCAILPQWHEWHEQTRHTEDMFKRIFLKQKLMFWKSTLFMSNNNSGFWIVWLWPGLWFNINMSSYQHRKSHCGDKVILRSSYLHNDIFILNKDPGPWFYIMMSSYQYRKFHCADKILRPLYLHNILNQWWQRLTPYVSRDNSRSRQQLWMTSTNRQNRYVYVWQRQP